MKTAIARNQKARIPLDVVFGDIDYMHGRRDFTLGEVPEDRRVRRK
jgi:alpha-glucosidase (family GH31 glycosyl hydrolase)